MLLLRCPFSSLLIAVICYFAVDTLPLIDIVFIWFTIMVVIFFDLFSRFFLLPRFGILSQIEKAYDAVWHDFVEEAEHSCCEAGLRAT